MTEQHNEVKMRAAIRHMAQFTIANLDGIFKKAVEHLIHEAQKAKPSKHKLDKGSVNVTGGRMPVDTGALRASLISEIDGGRLALGQKSEEVNVPGYDATATIARLNIGDTAMIGWTVKYAKHQEYGTKYFEGNLFMTSAAMKWQHFVDLGVAEYKIKRNLRGRGIGGVNPRPLLDLT